MAWIPAFGQTLRLLTGAARRKHSMQSRKLRRMPGKKCSPTARRAVHGGRTTSDNMPWLKSFGLRGLGRVRFVFSHRLFYHACQPQFARQTNWPAGREAGLQYEARQVKELYWSGVRRTARSQGRLRCWQYNAHLLTRTLAGLHPMLRESQVGLLCRLHSFYPLVDAPNAQRYARAQSEELDSHGMPGG